MRNLARAARPLFLLTLSYNLPSPSASFALHLLLALPKQGPLRLSTSFFLTEECPTVTYPFISVTQRLPGAGGQGAS